MKFSWHLAGQLIATTIQAFNQFQPFVPQKFVPWLTFFILILQAGAGLTAHFYTPEGDLVPPPHI